MTAENLSQSLRGMDADGLKVDGAMVAITDPVKLATLARVDLLMDGPDAQELSEAASLRGSVR